MADGNNLSQAEIWDDAALIRSWDDALAEYKRYHSLHARGELVEEVLKRYDADENAQLDVITEPTALEDATHVPITGNVHHDIEEGGESASMDTDGISHDFTSAPHVHPSVAAGAPGLPAIAQAVLTGHDQALKSVMMSWYYAGYYTGLYEGQQSAQAKPQKEHDK